MKDIQELTAGLDRDRFKSQKWIYQAAIWNFNVIGEAVRHVPEDVRQQQPELPWQMMRSMRNVLVHDYDQIDLDLVWNTIEHDLPHARTLLLQWAAHLEINLD